MIVRPYEYWESNKTLDYISYPSKEHKRKLVHYYKNNYPRIENAPYLERDEINKYKLIRIQHLVNYAYNNTDFYNYKYRKEGITPQDIKSLDDFSNIPVITKDELIEAFPNSCVDLINYDEKKLFATRSSGSSGKVVKLLYDLNAVLEDTLHGVRQWKMQSEDKYSKNDKVAMIYTCPWWFGDIGEYFRNYFISSLLSVEEIVSVLYDIQPEIISCYPSVLNSIAPYITNLSNTYLIVIHSEQSTSEQRKYWSNLLGVPVLDEYSSEEATRIALQLPCGKYHVCEDTVHLETIPSKNMKLDATSKGVAVVTNLLNTAMPIIRYIQGDLISLSESECSCGVKWSILESLDGRLNDSFITKNRKLINSGVLLDTTYRWLMETNLNIKNFVLSQVDFDCLELSLLANDYSLIERNREKLNSLQSWLEIVFSHSINLRCIPNYTEIRASSFKEKPIRCLLNIHESEEELTNLEVSL
ncbi:hypothetical protein [Candidatus Albibeggiatoa sp. nov. BB20]|uniref:phenylacetate--CoA ligase family protein n=1 Tax=Candidatus Albibeggiatoa sp. nov. BB20 TaxID=3162723 RepID=UPI003365724B